MGCNYSSLSLIPASGAQVPICVNEACLRQLLLGPAQYPGTIWLSLILSNTHPWPIMIIAKALFYSHKQNHILFLGSLSPTWSEISLGFYLESTWTLYGSGLQWVNQVGVSTHLHYPPPYWVPRVFLSADIPLEQQNLYQIHILN